MDKNLYNIFKSFFKVGTLLLGGGYVILPLLTSELVDKRKWITSDELCEYYSLGASLPGIIAVNTAILTGHKLRGTKGAIVAISGIILPAFLAIIFLASIFMEIASLEIVKNMFWGVGIGIITLLFLAIKEMWQKTIIDKFSIFVYLLCLILAISNKVSLPIIIILSIVMGILYQIRKDKLLKPNSKGEN